MAALTIIIVKHTDTSFRTRSAIEKKEIDPRTSWKDEYRRFVGSLCCAFYKRKKKKSNMDKREEIITISIYLVIEKQSTIDPHQRLSNFEIFGHWCFIPRPQIRISAQALSNIIPEFQWEQNAPSKPCWSNLDNRHGNIQDTLDTLFITTRKKSDTQFTWIEHWCKVKKIKIVISFKSTRLRVDLNDFDLLNPKMKLFLISAIFWILLGWKIRRPWSKGSRRRTDPSNKYPTCLKTVRREQIVRLFAQTSLH